MMCFCVRIIFSPRGRLVIFSLSRMFINVGVQTNGTNQWRLVVTFIGLVGGGGTNWSQTQQKQHNTQHADPVAFVELLGLPQIRTLIVSRWLWRLSCLLYFSETCFGSRTPVVVHSTSVPLLGCESCRRKTEAEWKRERGVCISLRGSVTAEPFYDKDNISEAFDFDGRPCLFVQQHTDQELLWSQEQRQQRQRSNKQRTDNELLHGQELTIHGYKKQNHNLSLLLLRKSSSSGRMRTSQLPHKITCGYWGCVAPTFINIGPRLKSIWITL